MQVVLDDVHVEHVIEAHHADAVGRWDGNGALGRPPDHAHGTVHAKGEVIVGDGLHHEVEGVHLVPLYGVLCQVGHKHQRRLLVVAAKDLCRLHAVDARQVDVHEDQVRRVACVHELHRRGEHGHGKRETPLCCIAV